MIEKLKKGSILSETSFYRVKEVNSSGIVVLDDSNNEITIGKEYVEKILNSADIFETEEKKNMTELADILINNPRVAMTVAFYKKDTEKTQKAYKAEKEAKILEITKAGIRDVARLLDDLIENPLSKTIPGELRIMKGRHYGNMNDLGRIFFVDMEDQNSSVQKQIDTRTIEYIIVNKIKYTLK